MLTEKQCKVCNQVKPVIEFARRSRICKNCVTKHTLEYYQTRYKSIIQAGKGFCKHCNRQLSFEYFSNRNTFCKDCAKAKYKKYSKQSVIKQKLKQNGLSLEQYKALQIKANGKCMICDKEAILFIDHCHNTNKIRGLLCRSCNTGLGFFKDNTNLMLNAIVYLKNSE